MIKTKFGDTVYRSLITWAVTLFGLTAVSVLWLRLANFNFATDFSPAIIIIGYSSSLAALFVSALLPGIRPVALLKQILVWRVNIGWYLLVLLGPLVLVLLATFLFVLTGGTAPSQILAAPAVGSLIGPLIAGSLGEEIGWRGFAQNLLQKRHNVLVASLIVGVLWATWHSWPVFVSGSDVSGLDVAETYIRLVSTAVIYGWIYVRTGSLLLVMLAHAGHNIAIDLLPAALLDTTTMPLLITGLYTAAAIALVAARPTHFLRQVKAG